MALTDREIELMEKLRDEGRTKAEAIDVLSQVRQRMMQERITPVTPAPAPEVITEAQEVTVTPATTTPVVENARLQRTEFPIGTGSRQAEFGRFAIEQKEKVETGEEFEDTLTGDIHKSLGLATSGVAKVKNAVKQFFTIPDTGLREPTLTDEMAANLQNQFGAVVDVLTGAVQTAVSPFPALAPDFIEKPVTKVFEFLGSLGAKGTEALIKITGGDPESEIGQSAIEAGQLASQLVGGKAIRTGIKKTAVAVKPVLAKAVKGLESKTKFAQRLVRPELTKKQAIAETKAGKFEIKGRKTVRVAPKEEIEVAKSVENIKGISSNKSLAQNLKAIQDHKTKVAFPRFEKDLKTKGGIFTKKQLDSRLGKIRKQLAEEVDLVNQEKVGNIMIDKFQEFMKEKPNKAISLWQARKQLDAWAKQRGAKFDAPQQNAKIAALKVVRNEVNQMLRETAKDVRVRNELTEMRRLFQAEENLASKAFAEAKGPIGRTIQDIHNTLGFKGEVATGLIGTTLAILRPDILAGMLKIGLPSLLGFKAGKAIVSGPLRQTIISILKNPELATGAIPPALPGFETPEEL